MAAKFGLTPGCSMDLATGYDFERREDQKRCWQNIYTDKPVLVVGSPPLTYFSMLQERNTATHDNDPERMKKFEVEKAKAV